MSIFYVKMHSQKKPLRNSKKGGTSRTLIYIYINIYDHLGAKPYKKCDTETQK